MDQPSLPEPVRRWLPEALALWRAKGIITPDQAGIILSIYGSGADLSRQNHFRVLYVLSAMAAFLFGASILLVIGYNWQAIGREGKLAIMLCGTALVHGAGFLLRRGLGLPFVAQIVHFLGCLVYGAGIWLVAQAYHIDAHYPDGMLWWALGVMPFVLFEGNFLFHFLYAGLLGIWCLMEVLFSLGQPEMGFLGFTGWPRGAYALPLLAVPGFFWAYRARSPLLLGIQVPLIAWWCLLQAVAWRTNQWAIFWVGGIGSNLLLVAQAHRRGDAMAIPYRFWGALLVTGALLVIGSDAFWRSMEFGPRWGGSGGAWDQWTLNTVFCAITLAAAAGTLLATWLRRRDSFDATRLALPALMAIGIVAFGYLALVGVNAAVPAMIFGNTAILGLCVLLIRVGILEERLAPFAWGIFGFLVWTLARYIDLFSASGGMLGAAGLFALAGAALLVVGRFWMNMPPKGRRQEKAFQPGVIKWPGWIDSCLGWATGHWQAVLLASVALQLGVVGGMVAMEELSMTGAGIVRLKVVPVDPRDFFRGEYVMLGYETAQVIRRDLPGERSGDVFVTLAPSGDGPYMVPAMASQTRPESGPFLKGRFRNTMGNRVLFGIEAFFVQEGEGKRWETAIREKKVFAEVLVSPSGKARLKGLVEDQP